MFVRRLQLYYDAAGRESQALFISRYSHIHGYDWIAIPLIPYLYAVDRPDKVLEWSDSNSVSRLRQSYRNRYLRELVPDGDEHSVAWTQLVGVSYDRRIYGLQIETTTEQDDRIIQELNSKPNQFLLSQLW